MRLSGHPWTGLLFMGGVVAWLTLAGPGSPQVLAGEAHVATIPDPILSPVPSILTLSPDGSIPFEFKLTGEGGFPAAGALIEIEFYPEIDALIAWGPDQPHPIITGVTDGEGYVAFHIVGAGCISDEFIHLFTTPLVSVRADGINIGEPRVINSPAALNRGGRLPTEAGSSVCDNGIMRVGLPDAVFHGNSIARKLTEACSDFTEPLGDGVGLEDALVLTPYLSRAVSGPCH